MALAFLDPYKDIESPVHRADARVKVALSFAAIIAINGTPVLAWPIHAGYALVLLGLAWVARISPLQILRRSALALPFVFMAAMGLPFVREGQAVVALDLLGLPVTMTDIGLHRFANVMVKAWLSVWVSISLIFTTRFTSVIGAMRSLGIPLVLTSIIGLMYRYMYVLVDEARRLMTARDARSAFPEHRRGGSARAGRGLFWRARITGNMIGTLFLRTYERSERIYNAMLSRGFDGEVRVLSPRSIGRLEVGVAVVVLLVMVLAAVGGNVYWKALP